ncbi:peptidase MA family metallohydrolase [Caldisalinibacter kiritimatiensis]|uniref:Peptidase MA-like domain-containing protein n=1 Tax=Caldisalinibacter kiritimatiensis TaxID=1304284 RepID=R1AU38_9FIRM|nr:hypothetical protein [Caldisalinibacter kiritimatiensis]EOD00182.1 hypothetical protein L21TH_1758 [Caldisalinibacter kiritimatiensis]
MKFIRKKRWIKPIILVIIVGVFINTLDLTGFFVTTFKPIFNDIHKKKILDSVKDYEVMETENFIIRYTSQDIKAAEITKEIAEKYYDDVCTMFDYFPKEKVNIIIYSDSKKLLDNTNLNKKNPPLGVYFGGVINILSPYVWIDNDSNMKKIYEKEGPIVHEFTHYLVDEISKGNYPMWLTEGLALYTEYKMTGFEWGKGIEFEEVTIEELNNNFYGINQSLAYRKSFEVVKDISETWGFNNLILILNNLGTGDSFKDSTRKVLKINFNELQVKK